jgi:hypothetical protein
MTSEDPSMPAPDATPGPDDAQPDRYLEVDDDEWLGQADWVVGGEQARKARRQGLYAGYVVVLLALSYGFPVAQAAFRTTDSATLRGQLLSPAAALVGLASVLAVVLAAWWAGHFRGPVVPPLPWIDLIVAAPVDRALALRRWWRWAVLGCVFVGGVSGVTLGAGLAFAGVTGPLAIAVGVVLGLALGVATARVWLWAQARSWPGPDRGPGLLRRTDDALRELHAESLRAHSANTTTLAGSALAGNLRTAKLALARPVRHARSARLRPGRPFAVIVRRDVLGMRRQPTGFLAGLGLTLLGGSVVAWGAVEPAAPGAAVTVGLVPLYLGFGAWAEGLRLQADNIGTPSLLGLLAVPEAAAHLVTPVALTVLTLAAWVAVFSAVAAPTAASALLLVTVVALLVGGHLLASFRGMPPRLGSSLTLVAWYLLPSFAVVGLGSAVAFLVHTAHVGVLQMVLWLVAVVLAWGVHRVRRLTELHRQ